MNSYEFVLSMFLFRNVSYCFLLFFVPYFVICIENNCFVMFNILVMAGNSLTLFNSLLLPPTDDEFEDCSQGQDGDELVSFETLFQPGNLTHDSMHKYLSSLPISADCLVQARIYPASDLVPPMS